MSNVANQIIEREQNTVLQKEVLVIDMRSHDRDQDSISESFNSELDAWARHCFAANGFGDF